MLNSGLRGGWFLLNVDYNLFYHQTPIKDSLLMTIIGQRNTTVPGCPNLLMDMMTYRNARMKMSVRGFRKVFAWFGFFPSVTSKMFNYSAAFEFGDYLYDTEDVWMAVWYFFLKVNGKTRSCLLVHLIYPWHFQTITPTQKPAEPSQVRVFTNTTVHILTSSFFYITYNGKHVYFPSSQLHRGELVITKQAAPERQNNPSPVPSLPQVSNTITHSFFCCKVIII